MLGHLSKGWFWPILPGIYDEVRVHLKEMLDIRAIRPSSSPCASAVKLVRKKGGKLHFCINLTKLNQLTIKDTYSIQHIEETLDCLMGTIWFTFLDLKSGYRQVKMSEESKALTTFMVNPLSFYKCKHMPSGLINAPATFEYIMEMCLRELQLTWCIIYLGDMWFLLRPPGASAYILGSFSKAKKGWA